jgi:hypothetical protein
MFKVATLADDDFITLDPLLMRDNVFSLDDDNFRRNACNT